MKKWWILVSALFIVIVLGVLALIFVPAPKVVQAPAGTNGTHSTSTGQATTTQGDSLKDLIVVYAPRINAKVHSPLSVSGTARGNWYFEASFPIELINASGTIIAQGAGQAQGDWMTTEFVPFKATLSYPPQPAGSHGTLVLSNDNPSGDPAKQKSIDIPITF